MIRVKICGMTNREDAQNAVRFGADALGFIFAESPRQIDPDAARLIIQGLPPFVLTVGVFVNETVSAIKGIVNHCGLDLVQLHGDETPQVCEALQPLAVKAFQIRDGSDLLRIPSYQGRVRGVLLDAYSPRKRGGTGETFDWRLAVKGKELGIPLILSGGLNPGNIEEAVTAVEPFAIDVNSGVEERPGKKSVSLLKELMQVKKKLIARAAC